MKDNLYYYEAWIKEVTDGDTFKAIIDVGFGWQCNENLRLLDVDAPETYRPETEEERERGELTTAWVKAKIEHTTVGIRTVKDDSFGRWLAEVFVPEGDQWINLGDKMIEKGLAVPYEK